MTTGPTPLSRVYTDATATPVFADVYRDHAGFVWRSVKRLGIPDAQVEDVMHEVFLVVQRRLPEYDGRAALTTWIYHLTRGVVSNWKRGHRREQARVMAANLKPSSPPDPEDLAQHQQAAAFVRQFLSTLDADKRLVFELAEVEGFSVAEIAAISGTNPNTAHSRLRAARKAFQRAITRWRTPAAGGTP